MSAMAACLYFVAYFCALFAQHLPCLAWPGSAGRLGAFQFAPAEATFVCLYTQNIIFLIGVYCVSHTHLSSHTHSRRERERELTFRLESAIKMSTFWPSWPSCIKLFEPQQKPRHNLPLPC